MMRIFPGMALVIGFNMLAIPAHAEIDYRCLNLCVNGGKTSAMCMDQCTVNTLTPKVKPHIDAVNSTSVPANAHRLIDAPTPLSSSTIIMPDAYRKDPAKNANPGRDYKCFNECLQSGMQYKTCDQQCPAHKKTDLGNKPPDNAPLTPLFNYNQAK